MRIVVPITCVATGETRTHVYEQAPRYRGTQKFWWTEGNGCCDCNRRLFFVRASIPAGDWTGELEEAALDAWAQIESRDCEYIDGSPDWLCSDGKFRVPWIEIDGERIQIDSGDNPAGPPAT